MQEVYDLIESLRGRVDHLERELADRDQRLDNIARILDQMTPKPPEDKTGA